jgi:hypothetical protein
MNIPDSINNEEQLNISLNMREQKKKINPIFVSIRIHRIRG